MARELDWDLLEWAPRPGSHPSCHFFLDPCPPGAAFAARAWLRDRWQSVQLARVAQRSGFGGLEEGLGWELLRVAFATARSPTRLGALWSVLVGDVVTQNRAAHFPRPDLGNDPFCPHCEAERETPEHRLWVCDAWAHIRDREAEAAGWASASALAEAVPPLARRAALWAPDPALTAAQKAAERAAMRWVPAGPPSLEVSRLIVWTDGAAVFPGRVGLARAAWGVYFGAGHPRNASGQVPGTQTIQRAELYAVVAATESACPLEVVSDSR